MLLIKTKNYKFPEIYDKIKLTNFILYILYKTIN